MTLDIEMVKPEGQLRKRLIWTIVIDVVCSLPGPSSIEDAGLPWVPGKEPARCSAGPGQYLRNRPRIQQENVFSMESNGCPLECSQMYARQAFIDERRHLTRNSKLSGMKGR